MAGKMATLWMRAPLGASSCACKGEMADLNQMGAVTLAAAALNRKSRRFTDVSPWTAAMVRRIPVHWKCGGRRAGIRRGQGPDMHIPAGAHYASREWGTWMFLSIC